MTQTEPGLRPVNPQFSSGPCAKRPGWTPDALKKAALGRSHRAKLGKSRLKYAIDLTREVLEVLWHSTIYAGMPRSLRAVRQFDRILNELGRASEAYDTQLPLVL